jgi:hypothetical protein
MNEEQRQQLIQETIEIFKSREEFVERNYLPLRRAYKEGYNWPEMDTLRHEITLALIFGLAQAGITLTNHLLESLLKYSLIYFDSDKQSSKEPKEINKLVDSLVKLFSPSRTKYGSQNLSSNINSACRLGIITEDEKIQLHEYRVNFRNAYGHSDADKIFGDKTISAQGVKIEDGKLVVGQNEISRIAELTIVQGLTQVYQAQEEAIPYFLYMDGLVRRICFRIFPKSAVSG